MNARRVDKLQSLAEELKDKYATSCYILPFDVCDRKATVKALSDGLIDLVDTPLRVTNIKPGLVETCICT